MTNETKTPANAMLPAIILVTHSTNPEFYDECDYAVVQLTPQLVDQIRRRVELAREAGRQDDALCELYFWGGTAEFYGGDLLEACENVVAAGREAQDWATGLEQNGHALVPPTADLAGCESQRVECVQMVVRRLPSRYEIAWTASPKHTDVYVTTKDLPLEALEGYAGIDLKKIES